MNPVFPRIATLLGRMTKILAIVCGLVFLLYIGLAVWFHHGLANQTAEIARAAGLPAGVESAFRDVFLFLAALLMFNALARLAISALNPFARTADVLPKVLGIVAISLAFLYLPTGIRALRGVDESGLSSSMESADPERSTWFLPDGTPTLFHSIEEDGTIRFWNRPGITPDTGVTSAPVTHDARKDWTRKKNAENARRETEFNALVLERQVAARRLEEEARQRDQKVLAARQAEAEGLRKIAELEAALKAREDAAKRKEEEIRRQAAPVATSASTAERPRRATDSNGLADQRHAVAVSKSGTSRSPNTSSSSVGWHKVTLRPGIFYTSRGTPGSNVEIRSDGQGAYHLPNGSAPVRFQSGTSSFHNPYGEFRILCGQPQVLNISFRWITP